MAVMQVNVIVKLSGYHIFSRINPKDFHKFYINHYKTSQAHVSFVQDMDGDNIRAIHCHDCSIVFLNKGPLILVAVSRGMETVTQLIVQLT